MTDELEAIRLAAESWARGHEPLAVGVDVAAARVPLPERYPGGAPVAVLAVVYASPYGVQLYVRNEAEVPEALSRALREVDESHRREGRHAWRGPTQG